MRLQGLLLSAILAVSAAPAKNKPSDAIRLSNVKTLTFRAGQNTAHRRVAAIPQLQCIGGAGRGLYEVDVMRCKNAGADYDDENIQWTCTASLPEEFKLGSTDVICEGYDGPDDPFVLKGSCGVEYRLALTSKGEEKYGKGRGGGDGDDLTATGKFVAAAFWLVFAGVILWMLYKAFISPNRGAAGGAPRRWGGYGGGGPGGPGDDNDDPPPPYSQHPDSEYQKRGGYGTNNRNQQWRPGFWTGAGTGAAAGYLAGNRNGGNSWFGGNNGEGSSRSSRSSSSSPSYSFSRHESTGFGSTSRR